MNARPGLSTALIVLGISSTSSADFLLDFTEASKVHIGGWQSTPPGVEDFPAATGPILFQVGNLTNFCGLFPGLPPRSGVGTTCGTTGLAGRIDYDTGADTFFLAEDTEILLQLFVKVGHPEEPDENSSRLRQNQRETFDIFLLSGGTSFSLAQLLDDVTERDRDLQNAYYLYTYQPGILPAGMWFPSFQSRSGSIEFLARLSVVETASEPASLVLMGAALFALGALAKRRYGSR